MKTPLANQVAAKNLETRLRSIAEIFLHIQKRYVTSDDEFLRLLHAGEQAALMGIDDVAMACRVPRVIKVGPPKLSVILPTPAQL